MKRTTKAKGEIPTKDVAQHDGVVAAKTIRKRRSKSVSDSAATARPAARSKSALKPAPTAAAVEAAKPTASTSDRPNGALSRKAAAKRKGAPRVGSPAVSRVKDQQAVVARAKPRVATVPDVVAPSAAYLNDVLLVLNPKSIDPQRARDRMQGSKEDDAAFKESIRANGQHTPILVRPHPTNHTRFELAAGARRLKAAKDLGIKVKAILRKMTDDEMVLAQALENSDRRDTSYIERALFAVALKNKGVAEDVILAALGILPTEYSRLINQVKRIDSEIINQIGPAPSIGRTRWAALDKALQNEGSRDRAKTRTAKMGFSKLSSDDRFAAVLEAAQADKRPEPTYPLVLASGVPLGSVKRSATTCMLKIDEKAAPGFSYFLTDKLEELHAAFQESQRPRSPLEPEQAARLRRSIEKSRTRPKPEP